MKRDIKELRTEAGEVFRREFFKTESGRIICRLECWPAGRCGPAHISVITGKPSDSQALCWKYGPNEYDKAEQTAIEFFNNYTSLRGIL